jgi:hypothetical protein
MERPRNILIRARGFGISHHGNPEALAQLKRAASIWRSEKRHMHAGYAMSLAHDAAWGDGEEVDSCIRASLEDFRNSVITSPPDSHEILAALTKWIGEIRWFQPNRAMVQFTNALRGELTQRLIDFARGSPHRVLYLVHGLNVWSDLEGPWNALLPESNLLPPSRQHSFGVTFGSHGEGATDQAVWIGVPGAFGLSLKLGDHRAAHEIIEMCPESFNSIRLRGWVPAIRGLLKLDDPAVAFSEAADLFATDLPPSPGELAQSGGSWSGENIHLWTKYFRALSFIEKAKANPSRAREYIRSASEALEGTESGMVHSEVTRLRILVRALAGLLGENPGITIDQAEKQLKSWSGIFGEQDSDEIRLQFLSAVDRAFQEIAANPEKALISGNLPVALSTLEKIPLIGPGLQHALAPEMGQRALAHLLGPVRTWIHRILESIRDESLLRKIILRLEQASVPLYAQIRHGPIEFGKDVVALFEKDGQRILRMHQVKCGDLDKKTWREAQHELEELFLVPLESFQVEGPIDSREGILIFNGHPNAYVEPVISGWIEEKRKVNGWNVRLMNLDDLVKWIVDNKLTSEFRAIVAELKL